MKDQHPQGSVMNPTSLGARLRRKPRKASGARRSKIMERNKSRMELKKARLSQTSSASAAKARLALLEGRGRALTDAAGLPLFGLRKIVIDPAKQEHRRSKQSNAISTESFKWWSFLPLAIYRQLYDLPLLCHIVLSGVNCLIPHNIRYSHYYLALPALVILCIGLVGECGHYLLRHRHHKRQNQRQVLLLHASSTDLKPVNWSQLQVGDIICLKAKEEAPCDVIILSTSDLEGTAYADVTGWLGVTSWQPKEAVKETKGRNNPVALANLYGSVICPHPTRGVSLSRRLMDQFSGSLKLKGYPRASPLSPLNFIVKGTKIQGVDYIFGIALYVGAESYIHRWSTSHERKRSVLARKVDKFTLMSLAFEFLAVMIDLIAPRIHQGFVGFWDLYKTEDEGKSTGIMSAGSLLRYAHLIPLSILPTISLFRLLQARRINRDENLGEMVKGKFRAAQVYNYDVLENLGSVDICFFNKTGTLSNGQLQFLGCTIGGKDYGRFRRRDTAANIATIHRESSRTVGDSSISDAGIDPLLETDIRTLSESADDSSEGGGSRTTEEISSGRGPHKTILQPEILARTAEARRQQRLENAERSPNAEIGPMTGRATIMPMRSTAAFHQAPKLVSTSSYASSSSFKMSGALSPVNEEPPRKKSKVGPLPPLRAEAQHGASQKHDPDRSSSSSQPQAGVQKIASLSLDQIFSPKEIDSGGDASLVYSPPSGRDITSLQSSPSSDTSSSESSSPPSSSSGSPAKPSNAPPGSRMTSPVMSPVTSPTGTRVMSPTGARPLSPPGDLAVSPTEEHVSSANDDGNSSSSDSDGQAKIVKHTSSGSRKPAFVPLLVGLSGELEPAKPAGLPSNVPSDRSRTKTGSGPHIKAIGGRFNLPPAVPGLLEPSYVPPMLQLPRSFRTDLHESILKQTRDFNDTTIHADLHAGERRHKPTLHFLRCLALCHRAVPYFVTDSTEFFEAESVRLVRGLRETSHTETHILPHNTTGPASPKNTAGAHRLTVPESPLSPRRSNKEYLPPSLVETDHTDIQSAGSIKIKPGPPYYSALRWELNPQADEKGVPIRLDVPTAPRHTIRDAQWDPELIGRLRFRASSSEEAACVSTAAKCGFTMIARTSEYSDLDIMGQMRRFELLSGHASSGYQGFTSIVCREESEHSAILYAKGPGRAVQPFLDLRSKQLRAMRRQTRAYTRQGYRSVVLAFRQLTRGETREFRKVWEESKDSLYKKSDRLERAMRKYQNKMKVLGVVILQEEPTEGAIESIKVLKQAGVALWLMTGDHGDFAVQSAAAAGVFPAGGKVFHVAEVWKRIHYRRDRSLKNGLEEMAAETFDVATAGPTNQKSPLKSIAAAAAAAADTSSGGELRRELLELFAEFKRVRKQAGDQGLCVVLSGKVVQTLLANLEMQTIFLLLTSEANCVICCRLAPAQKAIVILTLRRCLSPSPIIMAIGSGLGDSLMIRVADVGIASWTTWARAKSDDEFSGVELIKACDVCVASVASIPTLLVVHGAEILERNARTVFWILFRTSLTVWPLLWLNCVADFSRHHLFGHDWETTLLVYFWTFLVPFGALVIRAPPNIMSTRTATLMYNTSRGRWSTQNLTALLVFLEGIVTTCASVLFVLWISEYPGINPKGQTPNVSDRVLATTIVALAHMRFYYAEHESPIDSPAMLSLVCVVATLPALICFAILVVSQSKTYEMLFYLPAMLAILASCALSFFIHSIFCIILRKLAPARLVLAFALRCLRQRDEVEVKDNVSIGPSSVASMVERSGQKYYNSTRFSVVFTLVNRLIPYTVVLFASSRALNARHDSMRHESSSVRSAASTGYASNNETTVDEQSGAQSTGPAPRSTAAKSESEDRVRITKRRLLEAAQENDHPVQPGDYVDDIVSIASYTEAGSSMGIAPDLFDSGSDEEAFGQGLKEYDEDEDDSDAEKPLPLESRTQMDSDENETFELRTTLFDDSPRTKNIQSSPFTSEAADAGGLGVQVEAEDLIDDTSVRFKDQQLEREFTANNIKEREQFLKIFQTFFGLMLLSTAMEIFSLAWLLKESLWLLIFPVVRALATILLLVGSFFKFFFQRFDRARDIYNVLYIITYLPSRLSKMPPVYSVQVFAVWTLVISRMPFVEAFGYNTGFIVLSTVGDILGPYASWTSVAFGLVFNLGAFGFIGLAGHRLDLALRRRFLMNYQVEVSRRKQREILTTMLPTFVVEQMLTSTLNADGIPEGLKAENPGIVTVIFCDVYQFQNLVSTLEATRLVELLDSLFLFYDKCAEQFKVTKIETVFETYLSCAGIQPGSDTQSDDIQGDAFDAIDMGLAMLEVTSYTRYEVATGTTEELDLVQDEKGGDGHSVTERLRVKIGIHTGSVTSGVVGAKKPQYALFGDTVNTASRMKLTGEPDHIHVSNATYDLLKNDNSLTWRSRQLEVKGKGLMTTYLLVQVTGTTYPAFGNQPAVTSDRSLSSSSDSKTSAPLSLQPSPAGSPTTQNLPALQKEETQHAAPPYALLTATSQETTSSDTTAHDLHPFVHDLIEQRPLYKPSFFDRLRLLDLQQKRPTHHFIQEHTVLASPRQPSDQREEKRLRTPRGVETSFESRSSAGGAGLRSSFAKQDGSYTRATPELRHKNGPRRVHSPTIVEDVELTAASFDMTKFTEKISFFLLQFQDPVIEDRYSKYMKREGVYLLAVQYSLIIFMMVFTLSTVARAMTTEDLGIEKMAVTTSSDTDFQDWSLRTAFWWIRSIELLCAFAVWLLFLSLARKERSGWAMQLAAFLFVGATVVFVLTPTQTVQASEMSWKWFFDATEATFCFVMVHHNNGFTFSRLVLVDILIVVLIAVFLTVVINITLDAKVTLAMFPPVFLTFLFSAYVKELLNRVTWVVTQDFQSTEDRARELLSDMLPKQVLEEFQQDKLKLAYHHDRITFLFADIVGFTSYAKTVEPTQVVRLLQKLFARFDRDTSRLGLYKLCTIGDAYVAVSEPNTNNEDYDPVPGAERVWEMSQLMLGNIRDVGIEVEVPHLNMRIGLHFGKCVGGVIGTGRLRYDFWGMDVLTGNSMESAGAPGRINTSKSYKEFMEKAFPGRFEYEFNKVVTVLHLNVDSYFMVEPRLLISPSAEARGKLIRRGPKRRGSMMGIKTGTAVGPTVGDGRLAGQRSKSRTIKGSSEGSTDFANLERLRIMYDQALERGQSPSALLSPLGSIKRTTDS